MSLDSDGATLRATEGASSLALRRVYDGRAYRLRLDFAWPSLGLDMHVNERAWLPAVDVLGSHWSSEHSTANARFTMRAREHAQIAAILHTKLLAALLEFTDVTVNDTGAHLSVGIAGTSSSSLDGSMTLRDATIGVDRFSVESHWRDATHLEFTEVKFQFEPPLDHDIVADDPSLSAAARELRAALSKAQPTLALSRIGLSWRENGPIEDPTRLVPSLEIAARLVRALRGRPQSGPFR
jgi:hypothetical protein